MKEIKIAPSILSADFSYLQDEVDKVRDADYLHVDVMDGHFVSNITIGPVVIEKLKTDLFMDVHLMIEHPEKYIESFFKAGAQNITIHAEACKNKLSSVIEQIHKFGIKASVSLNPNSNLSLIENVLDKVDMVLLMTVYPGFGGQKFISEVLIKIKDLRKKKPDLDIQVDGGINDITIKDAVSAGANVIVAGSFIFGAKSPKKQIELLRKNSKN